MIVQTNPSVREKIGSGKERDPLIITPEVVRASHIEPEFVDLDGLRRGFGIKRSLAYQLLAEGLIKGVSLRRRNAMRGKRLFQVDSVRTYFKSKMESDRRVGDGK